MGVFSLLTYSIIAEIFGPIILRFNCRMIASLYIKYPSIPIGSNIHCKDVYAKDVNKSTLKDKFV